MFTLSFRIQDDSSLSGSGTVVIRTPRSSQSSSVFREPSSGVWNFWHLLNILYRN